MEHKLQLELEFNENEKSQHFLDETKWQRRREKELNTQQEDIWENIPSWRYVNLQKKYIK